MDNLTVDDMSLNQSAALGRAQTQIDTTDGEDDCATRRNPPTDSSASVHGYRDYEWPPCVAYD